MTQEPSVVIVTSACLTVSLILVDCHLIQSFGRRHKNLLVTFGEHTWSSSIANRYNVHLFWSHAFAVNKSSLCLKIMWKLNAFPIKQCVLWNTVRKAHCLLSHCGSAWLLLSYKIRHKWISCCCTNTRYTIPKTLPILYKTLVRPHLEDANVDW